MHAPLLTPHLLSQLLLLDSLKPIGHVAVFAMKLLEGMVDLCLYTACILLALKPLQWLQHTCNYHYRLAENPARSCRLLIERFGYPNTFLITAGLKLIAYLPLIPLLAFVDDGILRIQQRQQRADSDVHVPLMA